MSTVLSQSMTSILNPNVNPLKIDLLNRFQLIYNEIMSRVDKQANSSVSSQLFDEYNRQVSNMISLLSGLDDKDEQISEQSKRGSQGLIDTEQQKHLPEQPSYLFLRNTWLNKNNQSTKFVSIQQPQDHIDRINKAVAMIRQQTIYMTKKQNYMYERQESNLQLIISNPFYMRVKQQVQKMKMQNQQLLQKCRCYTQTIQRVNKDKLLLQNSLRSYKKKYQQMQKSWIEVSKKNICLEQESLVVRSNNNRGRLNMLRESGDWGNVEMRQSIIINNGSVENNNITHDNNQNISADILRPLDNVFIDIKLKSTCTSSQYLTKTHNNNNNNMTTSIRHNTINYNNISNSNKINNFQNEQSLQQNQQQQVYLKDVTNQVIGNNNNNSNSQQQQLSLSRSDQLITEVTNLKFRNIRNQTSARKTLLLSSARSVDISTKTSLNKPKFQRTKNNNLQQSLLKSVSKDNISIDINIQKPTIIKNQFIPNNDQSTNLVKSYRNQPRSFLSRREQIKS